MHSAQRPALRLILPAKNATWVNSTPLQLVETLISAAFFESGRSVPCLVPRLTVSENACTSFLTPRVFMEPHLMQPPKSSHEVAIEQHLPFLKVRALAPRDAFWTFHSIPIRKSGLGAYARRFCFAQTLHLLMEFALARMTQDAKSNNTYSKNVSRIKFEFAFGWRP
jgi:hypothetical protein